MFNNVSTIFNNTTMILEIHQHNFNLPKCTHVLGKKLKGCSKIKDLNSFRVHKSILFQRFKPHPHK